MNRGRGVLKFVLFLVLVISLIGVTAGVQYYLWTQHVSKIESDYTAQIDDLQATIDAVGPLTTVFTVNQLGEAGTAIEQSNLKPLEVPQSFVQEGYILDPKEVVGKFYKIDIAPGTPLTKDLVMIDQIDNTVREMDITAMSWPVGLKAGDYIDLEITYPLGEVYTVLSKVHVLHINASTIKVKLDSMQRSLYHAAMVDLFLTLRKGTATHMTKYVEPGLQEPAKITYAVPKNVAAVILSDPNILRVIEGVTSETIRSVIENTMNIVTDQQGSQLQSGRSDLINKTNTAANQYEQEKKEAEEKKRLEDLMNMSTEEEIKIQGEIQE